MWADGKLFVTETNGNVTILEPGPDGATELDHDELAVEDGRYADDLRLVRGGLRVACT